ncbi:hypothetical protein [Sulfurimonas sp.]|uniref:hypothetical protein n=1 Tax=Sulfurimonas sp. TaxID=2022749 RepID=UPI0025FCEDB4|nr:hypothetical protein [Sulfurimonas sp.]
MKLGYLPAVNANSPKAGLGFGFAAIGKSVANIGRLGDEANKYEDKLKLDKNTSDRQNKQLKLTQDNFDLKQKDYDRLVEVASDKKADETTRKGASISLFRKLHPKFTSKLDDNEVYEFGQQIDKLLPKGKEIKKLDTRVTPEGNKILTYEVDGEIVQKNLGAVKTEWGKDKSEVPENHVSVGKEFYEEYADSGNVHKIGKKFYAPINYVNMKNRDYIKDQHKVDNLVLE